MRSLWKHYGNTMGTMNTMSWLWKHYEYYDHYGHYGKNQDLLMTGCPIWCNTGSVWEYQQGQRCEGISILYGVGIDIAIVLGNCVDILWGTRGQTHTHIHQKPIPMVGIPTCTHIYQCVQAHFLICCCPKKKLQYILIRRLEWALGKSESALEYLN